MRYVFFDIECADGGKGSMCSFGYVICNESFEELESEDIVMNPQSRFFLVGRAKRADLVLAYPEETFRKAPKFPVFYERIRSILEREDQIVIGHSVQDDAAFLAKNCARYKLPALAFHFADSQSMYAAHIGEKGQVALDRACESFGIAKDAVVHKSEDDARCAMLLVREICKQRGVTLETLVSSCTCTGETKDGKIFCSYMHPNRSMFLRYLASASPKSERPQILAGLRVSAATAVEVTSESAIFHLVQLIVDAGGIYTRVPSQCDVFILGKKGETGKLCKRTRVARQARRGGAKIEMLTLNEFLKKLGVSREEFDALPPVDISWM